MNALVSINGGIPREAFENHVAILGKTGAGKTVVAKGVAERLLEANERVCIVDPTGAWWGLRLKADGVTPAFEVVIFGGRHGDAPIGKHSGQRLAEIIGRGNVPAVIDTSLMTVGERTHFFTEFADALFRENEGPLHLFIDEAHMFAPQGRVSDPRSGMMLHAANNLVSGGRSRGFRITMITQRPAKLHKDSLTQIETLVAMRLIAPQDRAAVDAWIGEQGDKKQGADIVRALPTLERGEGFVWAPELGVLDRVRFAMIDTFDSSRAPKAGDKPRKPRALDAKEVSDLVALLDAPSDAAPAKGKAAPTAQAALAAEYQRGYGDAENAMQGAIDEARAEGVREGEARMFARCLAAVQGARTSEAGGLQIDVPSGASGATFMRGDTMEPIAEVRLPFVASQTQAARLSKKAFDAAIDDDVAGSVLRALAELHAIGVDDPSREMVAAMCGFGNIKSARIAKAFAELADTGMVKAGGGVLALTSAGLGRAPKVDAPSSPADMRDRIVAVVGTPADKILLALMPAYPSAIARQVLAQKVGFTNIKSAGFAKAIAKLTSMGFVDASDGLVSASAKLFARRRAAA